MSSPPSWTAGRLSAKPRVSAYQKLGVSSRAEALTVAGGAGLL